MVCGDRGSVGGILRAVFDSACGGGGEGEGGWGAFCVCVGDGGGILWQFDLIVLLDVCVFAA